jgi:hypothetical protein
MGWWNRKDSHEQPLEDKGRDEFAAHEVKAKRVEL